LTFVEFMLCVAAEHSETQPWGLMMQAVNQSQQTASLLHGLTTGEGDTFQCMVLACPKHFLSYVFNLDFRAVKRMSSWVPTANTPECATLKEHHGA
jgi:hypothetical protein